MARIKLRRDSAANWVAVNPVLLEGEPGLELDTGKTKHGNGTSTWTQLPYSANTGYTGSSGSAGTVGTQGPVGFTGSAGVGFTGSAGTGGAVGFTGSQGAAAYDQNLNTTNSVEFVNLTVSGDILPTTDIQQDIGSPTNRFRDLYLSNNTIILGENALSVSTTGALTVNGNNPTVSYVIFGEGYGAAMVKWQGSLLIVRDPNPAMAKALDGLVAGNTVKSISPQIFSLTVAAPGGFRVLQNEGYLPSYVIDVVETNPISPQTYIYTLAIPTQELIAVDDNGDLTKDGNPIGSTLTEFTAPNGTGGNFSTVMDMSDGRLTVKFNTPNPALLSALQGLKPGNKFYINAPFKAIYTVSSALTFRLVGEDYFLLTTDYGLGADQTPPNIWESTVDNISIPVVNTPVSISSVSAVPTSSTSPGTAGQIIHSNGYIYICIKSGEWYRVTASTF
jgi:hypothetical protein